MRKRLGVGFPGEPSRTETLMGEMAVGVPQEEIAGRVAEIEETNKSFGVRPFGDGVYRVVVPAVGVSDRAEPPTLEDLKQQLRAIARTDLGVHSPRWLSRFGDVTRLAKRQAERHRVAENVLDNTRAQMHLHAPEPGAQAVRRLLTELMDVEEVNRVLIEKITAIDIRYDFGEGPDLLGRRLHDVDINDGHLYDQLHHGAACSWTAPNA